MPALPLRTRDKLGRGNPVHEPFAFFTRGVPQAFESGTSNLLGKARESTRGSPRIYEDSSAFLRRK